MTSQRITAVVVTYNPSSNALSKLIDWLRTRVFAVVIVDNDSNNFEVVSSLVLNYSALDKSQQTIHLVRQASNFGIANAQNRGIEKARRLGSTHVALFDQDSEPVGEMLEELMIALATLQLRNARIACVGPNYLDERQSNPPPFIRFEGLKLIRASCDGANKTVPVDYLIASGSLIPMTTLDQVGLMREDLFIDYVDIEWGLRAKRKGFQSYGVCNALMRHSLGDTPIMVFGKAVPSHSPLRHYYHFRNAVLLYWDGTLPLHWKLVDAWRLVLKYGAYSFFAKPRFQHWFMMTKGLLHGLLRKAGP
jgi:rhamnosyltransferase